MSELHELFTQLIATLRDAQHGVREEMRQIGEQKVTDLAFLERMKRSVVEFEAQAGSLVFMMAARGADAEEMTKANDLVEFFQYTSARLTALIEMSRG